MALFLIAQRYGSPEAIDRFHAQHAAWIERLADAGTFLLAGQTAPTGGSIILAQCDSCEQVERLLDEDAFQTNGVVVSTEITEFRPRRGSLRKFAENPLFTDASAIA